MDQTLEENYRAADPQREELAEPRNRPDPTHCLVVLYEQKWMIPLDIIGEDMKMFSNPIN